MERSAHGRERNVASTELLPDGGRCHTLHDGRKFEENGPDFRIEYQSFMPGDTFTRDVAIFGLARGRPDLFEAWCFVADDFRTYAFRKTIKVEEIHGTGQASGVELCERMGGTLEPPGNGAGELKPGT